MSESYAFVTLISSDSYLPGALVLAASLRDLHPNPPVLPEVAFTLVCLVTPETVDVQTIKALREVFDLVVGVEVIESANEAGLQLLGRPDLGTVLTKLHAFRLTQFSKLIFLDSDVLPIQPISHLFQLPHEFSATPDVGWPDIFNSGVFVFEPGEDKFTQLMDLAKSRGSWDGGDQGLLNEWRGNNWNRLSFTYNTTPTAAYTYAPAYVRFGSDIKAIHFIGANKPWTSIPWRAPIDNPSAESMSSYGYGALVDRWYAVYDRHYRPPVQATETEYYQKRWGAKSWNSASFDFSTDYTHFDLDQLRELAVEGLNAAGLPQPLTRGTYKSLPLEGRIHLLRPRAHSVSATTVPTAAQPRDGYDQPDELDDALSSQPWWETESRPPGREGLPPHLYRSRPPAKEAQRRSGSSETPRRPGDLMDSVPRARSTQQDRQTPQTSSIIQHAHEPSPPERHLLSAITFQPTHQGSPRINASSSTASSPASYHSALSHTPPDPSTYPSDAHPIGDSQPQQEIQQRSDNQRENNEERSQHQHDYEEQVVYHRPASPPMITWNPAIEPPPHDPPPPSAFALQPTYYENVWDRIPSRAPQPRSSPASQPTNTVQRRFSPSTLYQASEYRGYPQRPSPPSQRVYGPQDTHVLEEKKRSPQSQNGHVSSLQHSPRYHHVQPQIHRYSPPSHSAAPFGYTHQQPVNNGSTRQPPSPFASPSPFQLSPHSYGPPLPNNPTTLPDHHHPNGGHSHDTYQSYSPTEGSPLSQAHIPVQHKTSVGWDLAQSPQPDGFFHAPPPSSIPSQLVHEGHYEALTREQPKPDYAKVAPIFPWEGKKDRPRATRVFPDWEPKPPRLASPPPIPLPAIPTRGQRPDTLQMAFPQPLTAINVLQLTQAASTPPVRTPSPIPAHVQRKFNPPPEPPRGYAGNYANAWDEDHSIQTYAKSLSAARTSQAVPAPAPWPTHQGQVDYFNRHRTRSKGKGKRGDDDEEEFTNWFEKAEASSRDGDDEDDEFEEVFSPGSGTLRSQRKKTASKGNRYRDFGVQTDKKETKEMGVQVSMIPSANADNSKPKMPTIKRKLSGARSSPTTELGSKVPMPMGVMREGFISYEGPTEAQLRAGQGPGSGTISPRMHDPLAPMQRPSLTRSSLRTSLQSLGSLTKGSPVIRPRLPSGDTVTTAAESSLIPSPMSEHGEIYPQVKGTRESPIPSSPLTGTRVQVKVTEPSPPVLTPKTEQPPQKRPVRPGRVFDPSRGVDIFKKASEDVLAKFLRQGAGGWADRAPTAEGPSTPSVVQ